MNNKQIEHITDCVIICVVWICVAAVLIAALVGCTTTGSRCRTTTDSRLKERHEWKFTCD